MREFEATETDVADYTHHIFSPLRYMNETTEKLLVRDFFFFFFFKLEKHE